MKTIQDLTDDDLLLVFKHFTLNERASYEIVCKRWKTLLASLPCVNYSLNDYENGHQSCGVAGHAVRDHINVSSEHVAAVLRKFKTPTAFVISTQRAPELTEGLSILAAEWSSLEHLQIKFSFGAFSDEQMEIVSRICNKTLKHLVFSKSSRVCEMYPDRSKAPKAFSTSSFIKVLDNCSQLESVVIKCGAAIDLKQLTKLPANMKSLLMPSVWMSEEDLDVFLQGDGHRLCQFEMIAADGSHLRRICSKMADLTSLVIPSLQIDSPDDIKGLKHLRKLEELRFGLSGIDVNEALLEAFLHCRAMKNLQLTLCKISDKFLTELPKLCPNITCLKIYNYEREEPSGITDKSLEALAALQSLKTLYIPGASVTPRGVATFLEKCPLISDVNFEGLKGDLSPVVDAMVKLATNNMKVKYSLDLGYDFDARTVVKPPNLNIRSC